uniref:Integrase catalytic domain-containing protein n=1 Tax=Parascaris univalens TaxID=6257 RepID=A0A915BEU8_PARUN
MFHDQKYYLEVVHDLSATACIYALQQFFRWRGIPTTFYSDNGTQLKAVYKDGAHAIADIGVPKTFPIQFRKCEGIRFIAVWNLEVKKCLYEVKGQYTICKTQKLFRVAELQATFRLKIEKPKSAQERNLRSVWQAENGLCLKLALMAVVETAMTAICLSRERRRFMGCILVRLVRQRKEKQSKSEASMMRKGDVARAKAFEAASYEGCHRPGRNQRRNKKVKLRNSVADIPKKK